MTLPLGGTGRWVLAIVVAALAGCSTASDPPSERRSNEESGGIERTSSREERAVLTGTITDVWRTETTTGGRVKQHEWITVEEDPDARGCRSDPLKVGCEKMHFELDDTRVSLQGDERGLEPVGVLKQGQAVRADYTGQDVAESYPGQTNANTVMILEPR